MILAVTGLDREARVIARPGLRTVVAGGKSDMLGMRIKTALAGGARRILSIGICGALSPQLKVGDCIVATEIVTHAERFTTHMRWTAELLAAVPEARPAVLAGSDAIVADSAAKSRLHRSTNAAVADMESHIAARVAQEHGLPFAALRVVSDSASQSLPPAALVAMAQDGNVDLPAVLRSLARRPGQIASLVRTAWEAEKAFRVLFRCRHVLDAGPVAADLGELSLDVG